MKKVISVLLMSVMLTSIFAISAETVFANEENNKIADWKMCLELENAGTEQAGYRIVNSVHSDSNGDIWINTPDTVYQTTGVTRTAAALTGAADKMVVFDQPTQGTMLTGKKNLTVSMWVNFESLPAAGETAVVFDQDGAFRIAVSESGTISAVITTDTVEWYSQTVSAYGIKLNRWQNITVTISDSGTALYLDGVLCDSKADMKGAIAKCGNWITIGGLLGSGGLAASTAITRKIDDTVIYSEALTAEQVKAIAAKPVIYLNGETTADGKLKNYGSAIDMNFDNATTKINENGYKGNAISYKSVTGSDYMAMLQNNEHNGALNFKNTMTFAAWIKHTSNGVGNGNVFLLERDGSYRVMLWYDGSVQIVTATQNSEWYNKDKVFYSNPTVKMNEWTHVAAVCDGAKVILYINGQHAGEAELSGNFLCSAGTPVYICKGAGAGSENVAVDIDEYQVYDRALSQQEISELISPTSEIKVRNLTGDPVDTVVGGSKIYADASNIPREGKPKDIVLILAVYDENGALIGVEMADTNDLSTDKENNKYLCTDVMTIPKDLEDAVKVKAFLWDSLNSLRPYM